MRTAHRNTLWRMALYSLGAGIFLAGLIMCNFDNWPPQLDSDLAASAPFAAAVGGIAALVLFCLSWFMTTNNPGRYVCPAYGLPREERRRVKKDLRCSNASSREALRQVEILQAEQSLTAAPKSLGAAVAVPLVYVAITILMFTSGSPMLGCAWIFTTVCTAWSTWYSYTKGQQAQTFLQRTSNAGRRAAA